MERQAAVVDFTQGSCLKQIIRFSVPLLIGNLFQQLYTVVDSVLLGRMVSPEALAAAGTVTPVTTLLLSVIGGFTLGTSLVAAALAGQKREGQIRRLVESTLLVDMAVGLVLAAASFILAEPILKMMQTPADVYDQAVIYLRIVSVGIVFQCLYQYMADVLRGLGDSRTPLLFLILATVLNIVLDTVFILVFPMKVAGVAIATVIAQIVSAVCCVAYSLRRYEYFRISLRRLSVDRTLLRRSLRLGLPSAMQQTVGSLGAIGMQSVVNSFGSVVMNGYNAAYKVDNFIMLPVTNMGTALGTFVAQNAGAGLMGRIREGLKKTSVTCALLSVLASALIFIFAEQLVQIFVTVDETEIIRTGAWGLRVLAVPYVLCSQMNILISFFKGAGDVNVAFWASLSQVFIRLAVSFGLSPIPSIGINAVWFSMPLTWLLVGAFCALYYKSHRWERYLRRMMGE